ncbi:regulatory protein RecX [Magnetococcales bacterium HHB-1]
MMDEFKEREEKAYQQAIRWLTRRAYAEIELQNRLLKVGHEQGAVDAAMELCRARRFLNDRDFTELFVRERLERKKQGPHRIRYELRSRGVADHLIEAVLAEIQEEINPLEQAVKALRKRYEWNAEEKLSPKERQKRYQFLARRGFDSDTILDALNRAATDEWKVSF